MLNFKSRSYSYDTSASGPGTSLGHAQRDVQSDTSSSNSYSAFYLQFPPNARATHAPPTHALPPYARASRVPKMITRPTENISLYNLNYLAYNLLLKDTDSNGNALSDCTPWNIILEFTPVN